MSAHAARLNMLEVHANFKLGRSDIKCRKCGFEEENQEHLMSCSALSDNSLVSSNSEYQDINGRNTSKISHVGRILMSKYKKLHHVHSDNASAATNKALTNRVKLVDLE